MRPSLRKPQLGFTLQAIVASSREALEDLQVMTPRQAAAALGVREQDLASDRATGRLGAIPFFMVAGQPRYRASDIKRHIRAQLKLFRGTK